LVDGGLIDWEDNWLDQDNLLVICGDYIDRGPDSKGVLDLLITLKNKGANMKLLRGNHEDMLLQGVLNLEEGWFNCWLMNGGEQCMNSYGMTSTSVQKLMTSMSFPRAVAEVVSTIGSEHLDFMNANLLDYHIEDIDGEKTLFVHAGVHPQGDATNLTRALDGQGGPMYLWIRGYFYNHPSDKFLKNYGVDRIVFGHSPTKYIIGNTGVRIERQEPVTKLKGKLLGIDTGSYYDNGVVTLVQLLPNLKYKIIAYA
jgi:serine/threonine protein phosphatase 1